MSGIEPYVQDGTLMIPKRAEGPGGMVGVGFVPLTRQDPQYEQWMAYCKAKGIEVPRSGSGRRPGGGR